MRIAYVCTDPGIPVFGTKGASVHIQEVTRQLLALGHQVEFFVTRAGKEIPADLADLELRLFPLGTKEAQQREEAQKKASALISEQIAAGNFDLIYERYSLFSTVIADSQIPGILEVNAPLIDEQKTHRQLFDADYPYLALTRQVKEARATICVSDTVRNWVSQQASGERVYTVANGVNIDRIKPSVEETPAVVTFVGTLKPWHGTADLIRAAALAQENWKVRILGDGPERENLEALAEELGVEADFRGAFAPADMPAQIAGSAIGVAPYPAPEREEDNYFSPLKVYEYMAAGLAIVATRTGQVPAILQDGGLLVEPSNPAELAAAIDRLVADEQLRAKTRAAARLLAEKNHSWASVVATILELAGVDRG